MWALILKIAALIKHAAVLQSVVTAAANLVEKVKALFSKGDASEGDEEGSSSE